MAGQPCDSRACPPLARNWSSGRPQRRFEFMLPACPTPPPIHHKFELKKLSKSGGRPPLAQPRVDSLRPREEHPAHSARPASRLAHLHLLPHLLQAPLRAIRAPLTPPLAHDLRPAQSTLALFLCDMLRPMRLLHVACACRQWAAYARDGRRPARRIRSGSGCCQLGECWPDSTQSSRRDKAPAVQAYPLAISARLTSHRTLQTQLSACPAPRHVNAQA